MSGSVLSVGPISPCSQRKRWAFLKLVVNHLRDSDDRNIKQLFNSINGEQ
jgi:hypothetical protein